MAEEQTDARAQRKGDREEAGRNQRIPMGVPRAKLNAKIRPGFVGRWINDHDGRIQQAQAAGYEFAEDQTVTGNRDKKQKRQVGTKPDGSPLFAFLMEIREEFYKEDEALRMKAVDDIDAAMLSGTPQGAEAKDRSNFYVPQQHPISVTSSN